MSEEPKTTRSVALPDGCWNWIDAYATDKGMSPDDYLAYVINYYRADASTASLRRRVEQLEQALKRAQEARRPDPLLTRRPLDPLSDLRRRKAKSS